MADLEELLAKGEGGGSAPVAPPAGDDLDALLAKGEGTEPPKPSLWSRAKASAAHFGGSIVDDVTGLGSGIASGVKEVVTDPRQALVDVGTGIGRGVAGIAGAVTGAGNQLADIALHPVKTLGDQRFRTEAMRGVNDNIPLANRAVEAIGGPAEYSKEDQGAFPNARPLGGLAGMALPVGSTLGAAASEAMKPLANVGGNKLTAAARARAIKQGIGDIVGSPETGMAIDTDIKKMSRAIEPIRDEIATPEGLALADTARTDPDAAMKMAQQKLREITKERTPDYRTVDAATGVGGVRAGDFVKHLEDSADALEATGRGKDAIVAGEVRKTANRLKGAAEWGAGQKPPIDRAAPFDKNYTVGQYLDLMTKAGHGEAALADVEKMRPSGWNPDAIVPTVKLRGIVTDMQSTAYDSLGGINGTNAFKKAQDVAHVGEEFLNRHLDDVAKADPSTAEAVARIREMNRRVNAYSTIESALDSRVGKVAKADMKMSPATKLEMGASAALAMAGSPMAAATGFAATKILPKALSAADRGITRAIANRGVGPVTTANPAKVARLIAAARAGASRADLQAQAQKDNVPPEIADNIAAQNGL